MARYILKPNADTEYKVGKIYTSWTQARKACGRDETVVRVSTSTRSGDTHKVLPAVVVELLEEAGIRIA